MSKQQLMEGRNWYVIQTYAGYENAVMRTLNKRIESLGMEDKYLMLLFQLRKKLKSKVVNGLRKKRKFILGIFL